MIARGIRRRAALWSALCGLLVLAGAPRAQATIPVPDVGSPCSSNICLYIQNNGPGHGISGTGKTNYGIQGIATGANAAGVYGSSGATGVCGTSTSANGVYGAIDGTGFAGVDALSGIQGVIPQSPSGGGFAQTGVYGTGRIGVAGTAYDDGVGVFGTAFAANSKAIAGVCNALCAGSQNGFAGLFVGNVLIQGAGAAPLGLRITTGTAYKPNGGMWQPTSDRRVKKDVRPFDLGLGELGRVRPVSFRYNGLGGTEDDGRERVGVIAQDLARVVPFMVSANRAKLHPTDAAVTEIEQVNGSAFYYMLINAIQKQHEVIQQQDARIATLQRGSRPIAAAMFSPLVGAGLALDVIALAVFVWLRRKQAPKGGSL